MLYISLFVVYCILFIFSDSIIDHPYFDGCISDLNINQNPINILGDYLAKVGTVQCTELVKRSITFQEAPADGAGQPDEGYVHVSLSA